MSSKKKEHIYELKEPFKYAYKGDEVEAQFVQLLPPSGKHLSQCADLKQAFFRSLSKDGNVSDSDQKQSQKNDDDDDLFDGESIMMMLSMSQDVELKSVLITAKELFKNGTAFVDGQEKMTMSLLETMSMEDLQDMTGEYLVNFILASSLKKLKSNTLKV